MTNPFGKIQGTSLDASKAPIPNVEIHLCPGDSGEVIKTDWSDAKGWYCFTEIQPGEYTVRQADVSHQQTPGGGTGIHFKGANAVKAGVTSSAEPFVNTVAPVVTPGNPGTKKASIGFNYQIRNPAFDAAAAKAIQSLKSSLVRFFSWAPLTAASIAPLFAPVNQFYSQGITTCIQLNFQHQGGKVGDLGEWTKTCNAVPNAPGPGLAIEIGNELDGNYDPHYWTDTHQNYAAAFKIASPIFRAKGYKVIVGNVVTWGAGSAGQKLYEALDADGVFAIADGAGLHAYNNNAKQAIAQYTLCMAWLAARGVAWYCTELGLHYGKFNDLSGWAEEIRTLLTWVKQQIGTWLYFSLEPAYQQDGKTYTGGGAESPFDSNGQPREPFHSVFVSVLGIN